MKRIEERAKKEGSVPADINIDDIDLDTLFE